MTDVIDMGLKMWDGIISISFVNANGNKKGSTEAPFLSISRIRAALIMALRYFWDILLNKEPS